MLTIYETYLKVLKVPPDEEFLVLENLEDITCDGVQVSLRVRLRKGRKGRIKTSRILNTEGALVNIKDDLSRFVTERF